MKLKKISTTVSRLTAGSINLSVISMDSIKKAKICYRVMIWTQQMVSQGDQYIQYRIKKGKTVNRYRYQIPL